MKSEHFDDWDATVDQVKLLQYMALQIDIDVVHEIASSMRLKDAIMPVLEPTLYRDRKTVNRDNQRCIEAFLAYRAALDGIKAGMGQ